MTQTTNLFLISQATSGNSGKAAFFAYFIAFIIVIVFALLKIAYAWGGIFMALIGFQALRKKTGEPQAESSVDIAKPTKFSIKLNGPISIFMVVCGTVIATVDIMSNGRPVVSDARDLATSIREQPWDLRKAGAVAWDRMSQRPKIISFDLKEYERFRQFDYEIARIDGKFSMGNCNPTQESHVIYSKYREAIADVRATKTLPVNVDVLIQSTRNLRDYFIAKEKEGIVCDDMIDPALGMLFAAKLYRNDRDEELDSLRFGRHNSRP